MAKFLVALALLGAPLCAQFPKPEDQKALVELLSFEAEQPAGIPRGWGGVPAGTIFADSSVVHGGRWAARIERDAASGNQFSTMTKALPIDFQGSRIELKGFLKTEDVSGFMGFWMREDGETPGIAFDSMQKLPVKGTNDWKEYSISLPVEEGAKMLYLGVLLSGAGKVWADDLQLLVDGKPIWEAPRRVVVPTAFDQDHEFDKGSTISLTALSPVQVQNLVTLGKVWGYLKYYDSEISAGKKHWDYELFRILPAVLAARDRAAGNAAIAKWIPPSIAKCSSCAKLGEAEIHLRPNLTWLSDKTLLGTELSRILVERDQSRVASAKQFTVSFMPGVGNPSFERELKYSDLKLPDAGFQLLSVYRFWNIIEYWFPYRDVMSEDWDKVLAEFLPRVALAKDSSSYQLELMALIARVHDTHANLWSSLQLRPPVGTCALPVHTRYIEDQIVVTSFSNIDAGKESGLRPGDVITELEGVPVPKLIASWQPYYAASNETTVMRDISRSFPRGACVEAGLKIRRDKETLDLKVKRMPQQPGPPEPHDLPGETFRLLSPDVAYLKLSSVKAEDAKGYVDRAVGTKGLIIDIRNYPSAFVVFALGGLLVEKETEFVRFTTGDLSFPGAFHFTKPLALRPQEPNYKGKVVILVDESSLSQAEYTAMAFRASPRATVVGSTTAGADGNVSSIMLPGGLRTMISGIGIFYPDKRPTQRVGIIPDIVAKPTIAGIRAGRDEVLEAALKQIVPAEQVSTILENLGKP